MFRYWISWYLFAFSLLELIINSHLTSHDSSHGFINKNLKYLDLEDNLKNINEDISSSLRSSQINDFHLHLKFEPSILDFKQRQLGVAHLEKVTLFNRDKNKSIDMTSISGSTAYFHSSFFEAKKIPPNGNTTFNVVFLGREEGLVEGNLFIHSTDGSFKYNVRGATTFSRYRLRPIVGIKLPLNSTFSPLIYLYNPHSKPIQIVEVYSSGGEFHLELPSGDQEGPNDLWEIDPYETKAIIRVRFKAKTVQNHTAYIRIKLSNQNDLLVVPLEIEVTPNGEVFHPQGGVDFGFGGSLDSPKEVKLCVSNPMRKPIRVHSVTTASRSIEINYDNVRIMPDNGEKCTEIGTLTLDWKTAFENKDLSGKININYRQGKNTTRIPYYLTTFNGGLTYDPLKTSYFVDDKSEDLSIRDFVLRNDFYSPVEIVDCKLGEEAKPYFLVDGFSPVVLKPTSKMVIFKIVSKSNVNLHEKNLNSYIMIKTNVTDVMVPLLSYKGKLTLHLPFKSPDESLDLGLISYNTQRNVHFLLVNNNPVSLIMKSIRSYIPMTVLELLGCGRGYHEELLHQINYKNLTNCINIKPNHFAVIRLSVKTSNTEGQIRGEVFVETQYEKLSIPVRFKIAPGKLEVGPDRLVFDQCFPGKICSHPLRVHSTFRDPMIIEDIFSLPPEKRIYSNHSGHILAGTSKVIGYLYLNPNHQCNNECYAGFKDNLKNQWFKTFMLENATETDVSLANTLYSRYLNETSNGLKKWQNLSIRIDTSEVRGHIFKTRVKMSWPSLILNDNVENRSLYNFPLTQIGNISYRNISLRNPSAHNLVLQLVLDYDYPDVKNLHENLPADFILPNNKEFMRYGYIFKDVDQYINEFKKIFNFNVYPNSVPILLPAGQIFTVTVGFRAEETSFNSALLIIRNNLTAIEILQLRGQGVYPQFKFGNRRPGSEQPLSFEITERHLKDCEKSKTHVTSPNLTVKRSFTARNIGDITIYVNGFYINDYSCEGYGFKVINCEPFHLHPNATKKIDIAFTPDLTLSTISRTLILDTSLNFPVNYTLYTTLPPHYLTLCANLIARPYWEIYLGYTTKMSMIFLLFIVSALAVLDAEKVKKQAHTELMTSNSTSIQPVLDLRMIGQQTKDEIRNSKSEKSENNNIIDAKIDKRCFEKDPNATLSEISTQPKQKEEPEKNIALIPSSGKCKKRLGKKNGNDISTEVYDNKKTVETPKLIRNKVEEKKSIQLNGKYAKQNVPNKKSPNAKNTFVPVNEEETSSTTTDCSEDPEKENDQKNQKNCSIKAVDKIEYKKNYDEDPSSTELKQDSSTQIKIEYQRSNPKIRTKSHKEPEIKLDSFSKNNREIKRINKSSKDRKDKFPYKKQGTDKNIGKQNEIRKSPISPPIPTKSIWGENCAKFSDVVARTEILSTNRPLCQRSNFKQTLSGDNLSQNQQLGPVGSNRVDYFNEPYTSHPSNHNNVFNNNFFSNTTDIPTEDYAILEDFLPSENWTSAENLINIHNSNVYSNNLTNTATMEDPWNHNLLNSNSYWSNNFNAVVPEPLQSLPTLSNSSNAQVNYIWGSSPVWQPWLPEGSRTPTRSPPGFNELIHTNQDEQLHQRPLQQSISQRETYNPFQASNIWSQDSLSPWSYPQGQ